MMTWDQIIYFINHIADLDHADKSLRLWQAFWIMGVPVAIALFHIIKLAKIFRGNLRNLVWIAISLFWWASIIPLIVSLHSLIYVKDYKDIFYMAVSYIFFSTIYIWGIEDYFPRYRYVTDAEYEVATKFLDGSLINQEYPNKIRLYVVALWIMISSIFICGGGVIAAVLFFNKSSYFFPMTIFCIGAYMLLIHLVLMRWLVKCPNCHRPIYNIKYNKDAKNDNIYFVRVAWSILTKKKCECVTCHAQYYVK